MDAVVNPIKLDYKEFYYTLTNEFLGNGIGSRNFCLAILTARLYSFQSRYTNYTTSVLLVY